MFCPNQSISFVITISPSRLRATCYLDGNRAETKMIALKRPLVPFLERLNEPDDVTLPDVFLNDILTYYLNHAVNTHLLHKWKYYFKADLTYENC